MLKTQLKIKHDQKKHMQSGKKKTRLKEKAKSKKYQLTK